MALFRVRTRLGAPTPIKFKISSFYYVLQLITETTTKKKNTNIITIIIIIINIGGGVVVPLDRITGTCYYLRYLDYYKQKDLLS